MPAKKYKKKEPAYYQQESENKRELDVLLKDLRFKPKNQHQIEFCKLIDEKEIIICSGPAGVGKSMLSIAKALELLKNPHNEYNKIVLINSAVESDDGPGVGFLPGDLDSKLAPYLFSSRYLIEKLVGKKTAQNLEEQGYIEVFGIGFLRGINFEECVLVAEEFQNSTPKQMKTLLTRIGHNSKFIISGDLEQTDRYKKHTESGLYDAIQRLSDVKEIGVFKFDESDIVRNPIIGKILQKYKD